jgi:sigma-B regulation protein RsbU (phosphoserine phosphatase)
VLCGEHVGGARTWTLDEQNFAIAVANLLAVALADAERSRTLDRLAESEARATIACALAERSRDRLDRELTSAGQMQKATLPPRLPSHDRVQFVANYETSRHAGGDYYDVMRIDAERFALIVADVSGHGANAAIVMAMIRAVVHAYPGPIDDPAAVLHHVNRHFRYLWDTAMYATAIVAIVDLGRNVMRLSSAGHPAPILMRDTCAVPLPAENAMPLLWAELADIPVVEHRLRPGDRVVFYTDGVTDRPGPAESRFDQRRLVDTLARAADLDLATMVFALNLELEAFAGGVESDDDETVLAIEVRPT